MDRILVTGANGFVGRQLCRSLSQKGFLVTAAVRQTAIAPAEEMHYIPVGDIGPDTDWTEALQGVHLVVHLAGRAHIRRDNSATAMAEYERINTLGTIRLAQMAAAAHVQRFLFLSSVKVNGEETHDQPFAETDRPAPLDFYAVSKWRAEEGLLHLHRQGKLPVVIIRPPLVYGPGVRANFLQLIRLVDFGLPLPLGKIKNKRSLVGLRNLIDFIMVCLHEPVCGRRNISGKRSRRPVNCRPGSKDWGLFREADVSPTYPLSVHVDHGPYSWGRRMLFPNYVILFR